jgi:arylsulfatase A-like enzyme
MRALALLLLLTSAAHAAPRFSATPAPKLVVTIVFDQLRADYLSRFRARFSTGGFERFMSQGAWFPYGEYQVMQAMTGPGHSVILTGAWPARTGITLNNWYDPSTEQPVYCAEDAATPQIGGAWPHQGTSPRNLRAPTLGDAMKNAGLASTVVSLSLKDRAAILMGGHRADGAYWFNHQTFSWMSSRRYHPDGALPGWITQLNTALDARRGERYTWAAEGPGTGHSDHNNDPFSQTWTLGTDADVVKTPFGDHLLIEAAGAAIEAHQLGADATPDLLAVSFSSFDKAGHKYGPNHRRMEEMTVAADATVAKLLALLDARVGKGNYVAVLTGDHGIMPVPEYAQAAGLPALRIDTKALMAQLEVVLSEQFGPRKDGTWVMKFSELNVWLRPTPTVRAAKVHTAAARWLTTQPGIAHTFTAGDVAHQRLPAGPLRQRILNQYVPGRSGDVVISLAPFVMYGAHGTRHLSGHIYDRMVPLAFTGAGVQAGVHAHAEIIDLAPTLAWRLGILPPALSEGRVLSEVWR